ncbi:MAG: glycosyltransferase family 39 protein [Planctomycetes bacterium]|nr:glycosyltransferase family 39 protein [Planctomycetota bacterium]
MIENRTGKTKEYLFLAVVLIAASVLLLANLDNRYLWQDEAETALVSKTILTEGLPRGHDGKNFFSQEGEISYGKDYLWGLDPWFPFYLLALFFKVFGISTFVARVPFAIFGIATVALTYFFARFLTKDKKAAAVTVVLLVLSVPFLLLSRQCRYYSLIAFFSLLGLYGYLLLLEKNKAGMVTFLIGSVLLFHCNILFCVTLLATVFVHALLCHRRQLVKVFVLCLVVALAALPWLIWAYGTKYAGFFGWRLFNKEFFEVLGTYLSYIHCFIFPFFLLLIPLGRYLLSPQRKSIKTSISENIVLWKNLLLLILFVIFTIVPLSIMGPRPFFRYMTQLIPVFCVVTAVIVTSAVKPYFKRAVTIIAVLFAVFFFINYRQGASNSDSGMRYLNFFDYIEEITHDYDGPIEGIAKYLNENGSDKDTVAITYGDMPLKFYTNMRIYGGLTGEDISPGLQADWVVIRKYNAARGDFKVKRYFLQNIPLSKYRRIEIDYPDILWENRPGPDYHEFRTVKDEDKVVIYQKRN